MTSLNFLILSLVATAGAAKWPSKCHTHVIVPHSGSRYPIATPTSLTLNISLPIAHDPPYCHLCPCHMISSVSNHRLYAKLKEEDEAAKLYNRLVAQAESSEVSATQEPFQRCTNLLPLNRWACTVRWNKAPPTSSWPATTPRETATERQKHTPTKPQSLLR